MHWYVNENVPYEVLFACAIVILIYTRASATKNLSQVELDLWQSNYWKHII